MSKDSPSIAAIVGFSILAGAAVLFTIGVAVYGLYLYACRKGGKKESKTDSILRKEHNGVTQNSSARESKASSKRQSKLSTNSKRESTRPESARSSTVETTAIVVETESHYSERNSGWDNTLTALENVLDEEEQRIEEASQIGSEIQTTDSGFQNGGTLERQQPEILEEEPDYKRNSAIYAKVDDIDVSTTPVTVIAQPPSPEPSIPSDTINRREAKDLGRSNSILNRVQYFESTNSLVRPAKKDSELEGVRSNVVKALTTDFEKSDKVILGRAAPEPGDIHIIPQPSNHIASDPDSGEPLYAVPDRSRKSQQRKSRQDSEISDHSDKPTPQVPCKPEDI